MCVVQGREYLFGDPFQNKIRDFDIPEEEAEILHMFCHGFQDQAHTSIMHEMIEKTRDMPVARMVCIAFAKAFQNL